MQSSPPSRRDFLYGLGMSLGGVALNAMLQAESAGLESPGTASAAAKPSPLAPRSGHRAAKARSCIFLFMEGGPSHLDTFDPKPKLAQLH